MSWERSGHFSALSTAQMKAIFFPTQLWKVRITRPLISVHLLLTHSFNRSSQEASLMSRQIHLRHYSSNVNAICYGFWLLVCFH
jgi:hypothetical protein